MKINYALTDFGFLAIKGRDAVKFFQGYSTFNLEHLADHQVAFAATCNIQGNVVANYLICKTESGLLLRLHRSLIAPLQTFLAKYIVFSKAELEDLSAQYYCYQVSELDGVPAADAFTHQEISQGTLIRLEGNRAELWSQTPLETAPADSDQSEQWLNQNIDAGMAWVQGETSEAFLPLSLNMEAFQGVDFEKGCYLGQEIVARMHFRGKLQKTLHKAQTSKPIAVGAEVNNQAGKVIGQVVASSQTTLLAVIQSKNLDSDGAAQVGSEIIQLSDLQSS